MNLQQDIGTKLFNQLSKQDKELLETEGSVDLGYLAGEEDIKRINNNLTHSTTYYV